MNLQDYIGAIWRRRWLVLTVMALGLAAVQLVGSPGPATTRYNATVTLTVADDVDPGTVLLYQQINNDTSEVLDRVVEDLGDGVFGDRSTAAVLEERVDAEANPEIGVMILTALDMPSEEVARAVIESYTIHLLEFSGEERIATRDSELEENRVRADALRDEINEIDGQIKALAAGQTEAEREVGLPPDQVLQTESEVAVEQLREVQTQIEVLENQGDDELTALRQVSEPTITDVGSTDPLGTSGRMLAALVLSAVLGIGLAVMLHRFDNRVFRRKDVEAAFQLPVLAQVPHLGRFVRRNDPIVAQSRPDHPASEAYRLLRSGLELARNRQLERVGVPVERGGTTILVVSASAGVGRTTTVANLATAAVAAGKRVLVVGADLRGSTVGNLLGVGPDAPGLSDAVAATMAGRRASLDDYAVPTAVPNVDMLPTGRLRVNPGETLAAARFLIQEGRRSYDMIIIDTPPMLVGNDVSELVPVSDLVLVVARAGATTFDEGQWVDETADRLQAPTCGAVLIGARSDLQKAGPLSRLRDTLDSRRRPTLRPTASVGGSVGGGVGAGAGVGAAPTVTGDEVTVVSGGPAPTGSVPVVRRPVVGAASGRNGQPGAVDHGPTRLNGSANGAVPGAGSLTAGPASSNGTSVPAGGVPVDGDHGSGALPDITDVFVDGGAVGGGDIDVESTIQMEAIDLATVPVPGLQIPSPVGTPAPDEPIGPPATADGATGAGPERDHEVDLDTELPTFPDELDDEEEESIVVIRVATGRSAGPATSSVSSND